MTSNFVGPTPPFIGPTPPPRQLNPPQQTSVRNLQIQSGDPAAILRQGQDLSQQVADSTPEQKFGDALTTMLKQYQTFGSSAQSMALGQQYNAQDAQLKASNSALTDPSLRGYAPSTIFSGASDATKPYDPVIEGAKTTYTKIGDVLTNARNLLKDHETTQNQLRDDARATIKDALTLGGADALKGLSPIETAQLEKQAGYPKGYLHGLTSTIREREITLKKQLADEKNATDVNSVSNLAQQLVSGNLAPAELSKRTTNYNAVLKAADDYSMSTTGKHFSIAQADRDYKFANNAQTLNTLNYFDSLVGSGGSLDHLITVSNSINRGSFPPLNKVDQWAKLQTGDPSMAGYYGVITEVADQVAKILQGGGTGSGTSDAKLAQAQALFQSSFTKAQLQQVVKDLKPLLINRAKSITGSNPYLKDYADKFGFGSSGSSNSETVKMQGPKGTYNVPKDQIDNFKKNGYKEITFNSAGNASASNKVVAGYDLSTYATDPNHVTGIKNILSKIGNDITAFVNKFKSPINVNMIASSAKKYNVDPKVLTALLVQESQLGTAGRAVGTMNPGNVGNTDSGAKKYFSNWQEGTDAAAYQLARRRIG